MVTGSIMVGTAAVFFSLGGIFCLYIHSVSKSMHRDFSQELKCGENVENRVCCESDIENGEARCSREGICGNKPKTKKLKQNKNESNDNILPEKEISHNEKTNNFSYDETDTKIDNYDTKIGVNNENRESIEIEAIKIGKENNIDIVNLEVLEPNVNEIVIKVGAREEDLNLEGKKNSSSELQKTAPEPVQKDNGGDKEITQNEKPLMSKKTDEKKRKREEKEAKRLQQKQIRKREKEVKKKMQQEKKKMSKEKKKEKKGEKSLKTNKQICPNKTKSEQKNEVNDENEIQEDTSNNEIEQANTSYQKLRAILESSRPKNEKR